ncbi:unnamed protein product [Rotaria sp. Silwood1]|nr:unnamed protein product [Rotaria sp. Silwood1]
MPELYKLYQFEDGPELLTYAATILDENVLKLEQQLYSQAYSQANDGKVLLTPPFSRFTNALRKLHYDTELKMQKSAIGAEPIIMNASNSVGVQACAEFSALDDRASDTMKENSFQNLAQVLFDAGRALTKSSIQVQAILPNPTTAIN